MQNELRLKMKERLRHTKYQKIENSRFPHNTQMLELENNI